MLSGALGSLDGPSLLRESGLSGLSGRVSLVEWRPGWLEAACLGWATKEAPAGPMLVAALRHDPPPRSVHFWLTLGGLIDGETLADPGRVTDGEATEAMAAVARLQTPRLVPVVGRGADHGLVWLDGSLDHATTAWSPGAKYREVWPEGDGESMLRRFIEDSVELLGRSEANARRRDEGRQEINLAWPWGGGFRPDVPNLALRHGALVRVESRSWALQGLARLGGLPHGDPLAFGKRVATDWSRLVAADGPVVVFAGSVGEAWSEGGPDRGAHEAANAWRELIEPWAHDPSTRLLVVATGPDVGLACWQEPATEPGPLPFDERALDDRRLGRERLADLVARAVAPPVEPG